MSEHRLAIRAVRARPVLVPMRRPLHTGGGAVTAAPLVLIDLETDAGVTGNSYVFTYTPRALKATVAMLAALDDLLRGDAVAPAAIDDKLQRAFRLIGPQGIIGLAMGGIDMAAWDALAKAAGLPLVRLLGGAPQPVRAYNSNGLGLIGPERAAEEAKALVAPGFGAVKVRLGYADAAADRAVMRAVRATIGDGVVLMSDYNQCLSVAEAEQRVRLLDDEGLYWIEEPVRFDDYAGAARVRAKARTPIQLGENCFGPHDVEKAIVAGAADYLMLDAVKIGGVTGWLRGAALAEAAGIPVSSHLFPEISVHLLSVTPTRHWLEYVDWASPILSQPAAVEDGHLRPPTAPGIGLAWDEDAVRRFAA